MPRSPRAVLGLFCLLVTAALLFLFTLDPLSVQEAARPAHQKVASVLEGIKGWAWTPGAWSDEELDLAGAREAAVATQPDAASVVDDWSDVELGLVEPSSPEPTAPVQEEQEVGEVEPEESRFDDDELEVALAPTTSAASSPAAAATRPACARTMLFHFSGTRGFASEYNRFIRVAAVASHFDYEVVPIASGWMYGDHLDYFKPPERNCSTADMPSWGKRRPIFRTKGEKLQLPEWTKEDHVQDGGYNALDYVDDVFLAITTKRKAVERLHNAEINEYPPKLPLSGQETVHPVMLEAFRMQAEQVKKFWILSDEVQTMVDALEAELQWSSQDRIVVGMHIRLGDKCSETGSVKYSPLRFATPAQRAALAAGGRGANVCKDQAASGGLDEEHAQVYIAAAEAAANALGAWNSSHLRPPLLAVMSDDAKALPKLVASGGERIEAFDRVMLREAAAGVKDSLGGEGGADMAELESGFRANAFHTLSMETRVTSTRRFVRDLTVVGFGADAFVFTGSSNVGRLTALIGGVEKAKQGRFISCDTRWFGTAHFT
ncbi:hypothetical protein RQP46_003206 [Phenoliferia psychrophenolica]